MRKWDWTEPHSGLPQETDTEDAKSGAGSRRALGVQPQLKETSEGEVVALKIAETAGFPYIYTCGEARKLGWHLAAPQPVSGLAICHTLPKSEIGLLPAAAKDHQTIPVRETGCAPRIV